MPDQEIDLALTRATAALTRTEDRPSQRAMAQAVASALRENRHLIVQAGTGTGKSLAYLVPILVRGARVVVSTATKALQDQLATRDLPKLAESLGVTFDFAVLKGRSNYLCRQRLDELSVGDEQLVMAPETVEAPGRLGRELIRLARWADSAATGDRADLPWEPSDAAWAQVSVGARDCPGASRCPSGSRCFAEAARQRAMDADVVVVNTHLYATAVSIPGELLPPHDVVVFDEAHELEDIASSAFGFEISAGRLVSLARLARPLLDDPSAAMAVEEAGLLFEEAVRSHLGHSLSQPLPDDTVQQFTVVRERVQRLLEEVRRSTKDPTGREAGEPDGRRARGLRILQAGGHLLGDLDDVLALGEDEVAWAEGESHSPVLKVAPLDVGEAFKAKLWNQAEGPVAVMTSATIPLRLGDRLGLEPGVYEQLDVGSPFDFSEQALLYCPLHLPDPRQADFEAAMHDELVALMDAAEGRTLALFTSWRAMRAAAEQVRNRVRWPILTQSDLPKPALVAKFSSDEHSCLFATMGFWQGVDVPGTALSLVTIDRLPFARPDNPLLQARRAQAGPAAFEVIDIPRAATLLAQGTGRLIRSGTDRGVVAVFDTRLARASYRWSFVNALPPMRRTRHRSDVEAFLAPLREASGQTR